MEDQLLIFVRESAARGTSADITRQQLTSVGWDSHLVDQAIASVYPTSAFPAQVSAAISHNKGRSLLIGGVVAFLGISSLVVGLIIYSSTSSSISDANEAPTEIHAAGTSESKYQTYSNKEFHFRLTVPGTWSYKEYSRKSYGEFRMAFGLVGNLPKDYFGDGDFVWIRAYPRADKQKYARFISDSKSPTVKAVPLSGSTGFDTGDYVGVENNGTAFELHLPKEFAGDGSARYTEEALVLLTSFRFTQ